MSGPSSAAILGMSFNAPARDGQRWLLLSCPGLGLVEHGDIAADPQVVAVEPDGTLVGLAVFGIVDLSTFPLVLFLAKACQDVDANQLAALQTLVWVVNVELAVTLLQPDNLAIQFIATLVNLHLRLTTFCYPRADNALSISGY